MSKPATNNIGLDESMESFRFDVQQRLERMALSLSLLQDKESLYAWEHRQMMHLYQSVLRTIEERHAQAKIAREEPLPPVDKHGLEIHF